VRRVVLLISIALASCNRTPSAPGAPPGSAPPAAAASSARVEAGAASQPAPLPDGCWLEVDRAAEPAALLAALAAVCAPGTRPVAPAVRGERGRIEQSLVVPRAGLCVRAIAAGSSQISELTLEIIEADRVSAEHTLPARFALLGARGPVCLGAGSYRVVARARNGSGNVLLELRAPANDAGS
jgi:hypothetical protein